METLLFDLHAGGRSLKLTLGRTTLEDAHRSYDVRVDAVAPPFSGSLQVYGLELNALHHELARLHTTLAPEGGFELESLEGQLSLRFEMDRLGHVEVGIRLRDGFPWETTLQYVIPVDQSYLPALMDQLESGLRAHGLWAS